ncbi:class I SAM-dependent methyltransferase [Neolewinella persica]|uniref:class I SAM-dependent methyltransferase n=1 Tax=Neolewinella persica TaxID=70998 RepID=UPI00037FBB2D|nr:class I SAM-dependent methyltransferase [Neolewinella persica]
MPVTDIYDEQYVASLFDRMSSTYGVANYLTSFGFTERWRKRCVAMINWRAENICCYDLMSGMGEIWVSVMAASPQSTKIIGIDISTEMNARAMDQIIDNPDRKLSILTANALDSDIPDGVADVIVSSFGLKTFSDPQLKILAAEVARILRPGGQFSFIEISKPPNPVLRTLLMFYLKYIVPLIGYFFMKDATSYRMLGVYTVSYGNSEGFCTYLREAGLTTTYVSDFFGCATGARGHKPKV